MRHVGSYNDYAAHRFNAWLDGAGKRWLVVRNPNGGVYAAWADSATAKGVSYKKDADSWRTSDGCMIAGIVPDLSYEQAVEEAVKDPYAWFSANARLGAVRPSKNANGEQRPRVKSRLSETHVILKHHDVTYEVRLDGRRRILWRSDFASSEMQVADLGGWFDRIDREVLDIWAKAMEGA